MRKVSGKVTREEACTIFRDYDKINIIVYQYIKKKGKLISGVINIISASTIIECGERQHRPKEEKEEVSETAY